MYNDSLEKMWNVLNFDSSIMFVVCDVKYRGLSNQEIIDNAYTDVLDELQFEELMSDPQARSCNVAGVAISPKYAVFFVEDWKA